MYPKIVTAPLRHFRRKGGGFYIQAQCKFAGLANHS